MIRTLLVTGGSGFLGGHVLRALSDLAPVGVRVVAAGRHHPGGWPCDDFVRVNLEEVEAVDRLVSNLRPEAVLHLAGKTPPAQASALYSANTRVTAVLLGALEREARPCRVILAGSAAELGPVPEEALPVCESYTCRPVDAYGLSKWATTRIGMSCRPPIEVVSARIFNLIGPGMPETQAFGRFASSIAGSGTEPVHLKVGDLSARRDFVDVRDVAWALVLLAFRAGNQSIYNIGTGRSRSVEEGMLELIRLSGRDVRVCLEETIARRGPSDSRADITRIGVDTGWGPRISFETSLADLWIERSRRSPARRIA